MRRLLQATMSLGLALSLAGCGGGGGGGTVGTGTDAAAGGLAAANNAGGVVGGVAQDPQDVALRQAMVTAGVVAAVAPVPQDADKIALGRALMFDKILSGNKDISCATCHTPSLGTGDALSVSIGTGGVGSGSNRVLGAGRNLVPRNAPPLYNLGQADTLFWDGRVHSVGGTLDTPAENALPAGLDSALAAQAMFPVSSRTEMRGDAGDNDINAQPNELALISDADLPAQWTAIMDRLRAIPAYVTLFQSAYPQIATQDLGFEHAANAIAAFEEDQFGTFNSPFDRYVAGDDTALSTQQKSGAALFYGGANCASCHSGPLLSDFDFHNIAAPQVGPGKDPEAPLDLGRFGESGVNQDRFSFRTPPLRNVALSGPWMHSGPYTSLNAVVTHYRNPTNSIRNYNAGQLRGDLQSLVFTQQQIAAGILNNLDPQLQPVNLSQQDVADLVAFLGALTDPTAVERANDIPANVPSGLPVND